MPAKKLSSRYIGLRGLALATRLVPALKASRPYYPRTLALVEAGETRMLTEHQALALTPRETAYARSLLDPPPMEIDRSVALVTLKDATLLGNIGSIVDEKRGLLLVPRDWPGRISHHDYRAGAQRLVEKRGARYFTMVGEPGGHRNYFHFLLERLPRLYYLLERFGERDVTIVTNSDLPAYQRDVYGFVAARYPGLRFEALPQGERWRCETLLTLDDHQPVKRTFADPAMLAFLRALIFDGFGIVPPANPRARLFISRKDTRKRQLWNEAEIAALCARHGFEAVEAGRLSFREQVRRFAEAEAIAGPHGAGFANMLFADTGAKAIEICNSERLKNTYFLLAKSLGQTHWGVDAGKGDRGENFRVAPALVEEALAALAL